MKLNPTFVDPLSDWGFKNVLGAEQNKDILISILNNIIDDRVITDLSYLNTEHTYLNVPDGKSTFDIYCKCQDGSRVIIEMQNKKLKLFPSRAFAYSAMSIMDQARPKWKYDFEKIYFIAFLNYEMFKNSRKWFHKLALTELETDNPYIYDNYLQIYVEMPKFAQNVDSSSDFRDKLIFSMKAMGKTKTLPDFIHEQEIVRFYDAARFNTFSTEKQSEYLQEMLTKEEYQDAMNYAIEEAEQRGLEKGMEKGIEKGMEKGKNQGLKEGIEKTTLAIASRMKALGKPDEEIALITGLSPKEIQNL